MQSLSECVGGALSLSGLHLNRTSKLAVVLKDVRDNGTLMAALFSTVLVAVSMR